MDAIQRLLLWFAYLCMVILLWINNTPHALESIVGICALLRIADSLDALKAREEGK